jgi:hypothetical protein
MKKKCDFWLLSYGEDQFQRNKIKKARIDYFFKKFFITHDIDKVSTLKKFLKKNEKAIFIDDNPGALFKIKEQFPLVITVRINRGEGKYTKEKNNKNIDFKIKKLEEIEKILKE